EILPVEHGLAQSKGFTLLNIIVNGRIFQVGVLAGAFEPGELSDRRKVAANDLGPVIGPVLVGLNGTIVAVQPVVGPTVWQLMNQKGFWGAGRKRGLDAMIEAVIRLWQKGLSVS